jgi:sugar lactone lactonase YvrE
MQYTALLLVILLCLPVSTAFAQPRVWIADQGNNQNGAANPNNRILEIDPFNKKVPADAQGDVIILKTLPSPAGAFLDELTFDDQQRLWCVVKNTSDQVQDGATRIDKETGAIQHQIFPFIPGHVHGSYLEGLAWDGSGLWITGVRDFSGPNGSVLTRVDPATGNRIAPFDAGSLGTAGRVSIPGNICQGLLYDPSGTGYLWHSDSVLNKIYKLDLARLYDADPGNDNSLAIAEHNVPFSPKGMDWMGDKIWVASPHNGIWEFNPATGATQKLFSTPQWNLDGLAVLPEPPGPKIVADPEAVERSVWLGGVLDPSILTVANGGTETLEYTLTEDAPWLTIHPTTGDSTGEADPITLTFDLTGLKAGTYSADLTITAPGAYNSPLIVPVEVIIETVKPDLDDDGDVDQEDFGLFQICYTGSGINAPAGCTQASFDNDLDVDLEDFGVFQRCHTRANVRAEPSCDDEP